MNRSLVTTAITAFLLYAPYAQADPITGTLSLTGTDSFTPNSISFTGLGSVAAGSGSFAAIGTCTGCVALNDFTSSSANFLAHSVSNGGEIASLTVTDITSFDFVMGVDFDTLTITGDGLAALTGFDATAVSFSLTSNALIGHPPFSFTWTTTATPVPEPASLTLLGSALACFAWLRRGRRRAAPAA